MERFKWIVKKIMRDLKSNKLTFVVNLDLESFLFVCLFVHVVKILSFQRE